MEKKNIKGRVELSASVIAIFIFITGINALPDLFSKNNSQKEIGVVDDSQEGTGVVDDSQEGTGVVDDSQEGTGVADDFVETIKYLYDLETVSGELSISTRSTTDVFGNTYGTHFSVYLAEFPTSYAVQSAKYVTNMKYSKFVGTLFTESNAPNKSAFRLEILLDDVKIYQSDIMTKLSDPCEINLDISGGKIFELVFYFEDGTGGMEDGWYKQATANLAEAQFLP